MSSANTNDKNVTDGHIPAQGDHPAPVDLDHTYTKSTGSGDVKQVAKQVAGDAADAARAKLEDARRQAGEVADTAKAEVGRRYEAAKDFTRQAADQARAEADRRMGEARVQFESAKRELSSRVVEGRRVAGERASAMYDEQKGRLKGGVNDLAAAARAAAGELRGRDDTTVAGYAEAAADSLERVRDYLDHASPRDLVGELAGLTKRRPEWVLGGAFVLGLGLSRFLKADQPHRRGLPEGADESLFDDAVRQQRYGSTAQLDRSGVARGTQFSSEPVGTALPAANVGVGRSDLHETSSHRVQPAEALVPDLVGDGRSTPVDAKDVRKSGTTSTLPSA